MKTQNVICPRKNIKMYIINLIYTNVFFFFLSRPASILISVCETPKKVLRERVNNYKNMFEMSMKENNELREFTTLEKQMFRDNVSYKTFQINKYLIIIYGCYLHF